MSPKEMQELADNVGQFMSSDAIKIIGVEAKNHFKGSFERGQEGFINDGLNKWKDLKPSSLRAKSVKNGSSAPILTESGRLASELEDYNSDYNKKEVIFSLNAPYAKIHNEGGEISGVQNVKAHSRNGVSVKSHNRNVHTVMPQRQFMGESKELDEKILKKFTESLDKLFE